MVRPCRFEHVRGHPAGGPPEGEDDHDDVVDEAEAGHDVGDEVDRRQHPDGGENDDDLHPQRDVGVAGEAAQGRGRRRHGRREVPEAPGRQAAGGHGERGPRGHHDRHGDRRDRRHGGHRPGLPSLAAVRHRFVALLVVVVLVLAPAGPVWGQTSTTSVDPDATGIIPEPDSGRPPEDAGDRGGWAQLAVLGLTVGGVAVVGLLAARNARRARARP